MPRQIVPGRTYLITRRCTQRQFLLRPDEETNQAFVYCLAVASQRYSIAIHGFVANSNHYHSVLTDTEGRLPEFLEHFHKLVAKHQNVLHGRTENMWSSQRTSVVRLMDTEDALSKLVYTLTNPVKDQLVEKAHQWPGAISYHACLNDKVMTVQRPRRFFKAKGPMVKEIQLECLPLPSYAADRSTYQELLRSEIARVEADAALERKRTHRRVMGRKAVLAQQPEDRPASVKSDRGMNPQFAARDMGLRNQALGELREFYSAYFFARDMWVSDKSIAFPPGTWWMAKRAGVACVPLDQLRIGTEGGG
jgi:putative transposase